MITIILLGALLSISMGALIGSAWTTQALEGRFRHHAAERRRLNQEWAAVRALRERQRRCIDCEDELSWHPDRALVSAPDDEDD